MKTQNKNVEDKKQFILTSFFLKNGRASTEFLVDNLFFHEPNRMVKAVLWAEVFSLRIFIAHVVRKMISIANARFDLKDLVPLPL